MLALGVVNEIIPELELYARPPGFQVRAPGFMLLLENELYPG